MSRAAVVVLALAIAVFAYLRGRADTWVDVDEAAALRGTRQLLGAGETHRRRDAARLTTIDSLRQRETAATSRAAGDRIARIRAEQRAESLLVAGDTAAAVGALETALETARRELGNLGEAYEACDEAGQIAMHGWVQCRARRASLETYLRSTAQLLERRRSFHLLFVKLPRPPKVLAAGAGCLGGALLDQADPLRGCGLGAAGTQLLVPTR